MKPVTWEAAGAEVYLPIWEKRAQRYASILKGITPVAIPDLSGELRNLGRTIVNKEAQAGSLNGDVDFAQVAVSVLGSALAVALHQQGWELYALPGEEVCAQRGEQTIKPFETMQQLALGKLDAAAWREQCAEARISNVDLGEPRTRQELNLRLSA